MKFIDKKKATTYKLVYRSQEDPLAFEEGGSERVFVEVNPRNPERASSKGKEVEDQTLQQSLRDLGLEDIDEEEEEEAGKAALYGIYLDDSKYDYTKHLRQVGTGGGVLLEAQTKKARPGDIHIKDEGSSSMLPSEVLPSKHHMDIRSEAVPLGLQPFMDSRVREVFEALEDEDAEEFDDDFLDQLNADQAPSGEEDEDDGWSNANEEDEDDFDAQDVFAQVRRMKAQQKKQQLSDDDFDDDDSNGGGWKGSRSVSTGFSMSSSAMYRNANLTLLDEQFDRVEAMYEEEDSESNPDEDYMGDGTGESVSTRPDFENVLDEFLNEYELTGKKMQVVLEGGTGQGKLDTVREALLDANVTPEESRRAVLATGLKMFAEDNMRTREEDDKELEAMLLQKEERTPWDCQTILTTYSTLDNHPSTIYEARTPRIRVSRKTGFPVVENNGEEEKEKEKENENENENGTQEESVRVNKGEARSRNETAEEKRERKKLLQEAKRNRREQKRETQGIFAEKRERRMQSKKDRAQYAVHLD
ncbi:Protein ltv1 [Coemansia sp. Benny D115]|nr:Protein ltv1 [Coemansia sp. Benny D115]